jgi:lipopolysaccharide/colanic/teichoic acid biosynthesis glycosyltransferase
VISTGIPVGAGNHVLVEQQLFGGGGPAHDVFLIALAELGPLGLLGWLSIFGSLLLLAWRRRAEPAARTGPLVAIASLSPLLLFDHYLWTLAPGRVLVVWALAVLTAPPIAWRIVAAERHARSLTLAGKRLADVAVATGALIALAPVFGLVAALVWLDSGTPIVFRAKRLGRAGRLFTMYKFRTMTPGSENALLNLRARNLAQGMVKIVDDPRVTVIGSWLRRFSLDELPQLWNVVRGDMSLVGPRPHQIGEVSPDDDGHRQRLAMRPGLTGLWQVKARTNPSLAVRVHYDLEYISRWSPWLDLGVILATIPVVLRGDGGQVRFPDRQLLKADQRADVPETSPI